LHFKRFVLLPLLILCFLTPVFAWDMIDVVFNPPEGGTIIFSHDTHLASPKIDGDCSLCHASLFKKKFKKPVTMAEMYQGKSCGGCHSKTAFTLDACDRCHAVKDVTFTVRPTGDVPFPHDPHTAKYKCDVCHPMLYKAGRNKPVTMAEMEKQGKSCGACHNKVANLFPLRECARCHQAQDVFIKVQGAGPVTFSHAFHTKKEKYACSECHQKIFALDYKRTVVSMNAMEYGKSCGACHDDYKAFTIRENCVRCHDM